MARFDRLLDGEYRNLIALEKQVALAKLVTVGDIYWNCIYIPSGSMWIKAEDEGRIDCALDACAGQLERIESDPLQIQRWSECGYIVGEWSTPSRGGLYRFLLVPHGEDYLAYRRRNTFAHWLIDLLMKPVRGLLPGALR